MVKKLLLIFDQGSSTKKVDKPTDFYDTQNESETKNRGQNKES